MRKLVASLFVSLDGVIEAPQRWHMPYINEEVGAVLQEQIADSDAFLLGRATYPHAVQARGVERAGQLTNGIRRAGRSPT